jgi:hypothetical protein
LFDGTPVASEASKRRKPVACTHPEHYRVKSMGADVLKDRLHNLMYFQTLSTANICKKDEGFAKMAI